METKKSFNFSFCIVLWRIPKQLLQKMVNKKFLLGDLSGVRPKTYFLRPFNTPLVLYNFHQPKKSFVFFNTKESFFAVIDYNRVHLVFPKNTARNSSLMKRTLLMITESL